MLKTSSNLPSNLPNFIYREGGKDIYLVVIVYIIIYLVLVVVYISINLNLIFIFYTYRVWEEYIFSSSTYYYIFSSSNSIYFN